MQRKNVAVVFVSFQTIEQRKIELRLVTYEHSGACVNKANACCNIQDPIGSTHLHNNRT